MAVGGIRCSARVRISLPGVLFTFRAPHLSRRGQACRPVGLGISSPSARGCRPMPPAWMLAAFAAARRASLAVENTAPRRCAVRHSSDAGQRGAARRRPCSASPRRHERCPAGEPVRTRPAARRHYAAPASCRELSADFKAVDKTGRSQLETFLHNRFFFQPSFEIYGGKRAVPNRTGVAFSAATEAKLTSLTGAYQSVVQAWLGSTTTVPQAARCSPTSSPFGANISSLRRICTRLTAR